MLADRQFLQLEEINLVAGRADVGRNRGADLERTVNLAALDVQVERRDKVEIILVGRRRAKVFLGAADDLDRRILVELVRPEGHLDAVDRKSTRLNSSH